MAILNARELDMYDEQDDFMLETDKRGPLKMRSEFVVHKKSKNIIPKPRFEPAQLNQRSK